MADKFNVSPTIGGDIKSEMVSIGGEAFGFRELTESEMMLISGGWGSMTTGDKG